MSLIFISSRLGAPYSVDKQRKQKDDDDGAFEQHDVEVGQRGLEQVHGPEEVRPVTQHLVERQEVFVPLEVLDNCCCCGGLAPRVVDYGRIRRRLRKIRGVKADHVHNVTMICCQGDSAKVINNAIQRTKSKKLEAEVDRNVE